MQTTTKVTYSKNQFMRMAAFTLLWLLLMLMLAIGFFIYQNIDANEPANNTKLATHACIEYYPELNPHIAHIQCGEITNYDMPIGE